MKKTTVSEDYLENFIPVYETTCHKNQLKFFCPIIDANSFYYDGLIVSLRDAAGHYCLSRRTWEEYLSRPMELSHLVREKFRKLDQNTGELGELMLFSFLETDLKAPKILTKMELKTNPNLYFNGADGVHYLKLSNANYQLIFGESKAHADLKSGIENALESVQKFIFDSIKDDASGSTKGITFEKGLINACIAHETFSEEEKKFIKSLVYPKSTNPYSVDTAFGVFILYNITIDNAEKQRGNEDFRNWLLEKLKSQIAVLVPDIIKDINGKNLAGHAFYFYIVPFENMEIDRTNILTQVVE